MSNRIKVFVLVLAVSVIMGMLLACDDDNDASSAIAPIQTVHSRGNDYIATTVPRNIQIYATVTAPKK